MKISSNTKIATLLFTTVTLLSACQWGTKTDKAPSLITIDTLKYKYEEIHNRADDCGDKADSACTNVSINYPVFENQKALNDTITNKLISMFIMDDKKPDTSLVEMGENFIKAYVAFRKTDPRSFIYFTMDSHAKVIEQDSALVAIKYGGYTFQGGAHGASFTGFINWDVKTSKNVTLNDILVDGSHAELTKIAEKIFRKNEKLTDTSSLANDYFFKDNKFALNDNFSVTPLGLNFIYNQYEIKPYAAGITELFVPYSQIEKIIKPNSVVSQYIKK